MNTRLVIAAHGTRSPVGAATVRAIADAVRAERPSVRVDLGYLDVQEPTLADALGAESAVVVPLLLSAGFHVTTDIPAVVEGRDGVVVTPHLGPDPAVLDAVAERLAEGLGQTRSAERVPAGSPVLLAVVPSSRESARTETERAAALLAERLRRPVTVLPLSSRPELSGYATPLTVASYLLAEGGFLDSLRTAVGEHGVLAAPIGPHPRLVELVWSRYDAAAATEPLAPSE